ncbi:uncharacterized protein MKK02DRAFT_21179 [Dioszegia hungarica]|uniref:PCI domain-containing protein n=1 Tax=Dioszegia hungarica TaxID=4972 RepID=A0AA38H423_9TREE|nr:uncharacterized protein MKK02DRAFT_21179 [Dioszegia hungarica]KAI9631974.1 hypothetical protein MKK02DRAFT_21179 [Dioszegia hungarica]
MAQPRKQEKDFTAEVAALVPEVEGLAKDGKLIDAVEKITAMEKQTRNAADMTSTATLLTTLATIIHSAGDLDMLNQQLTIMSKKHGQLKEAVVRMVDEAMKWLPALKEKKEKGEYKGGKDRWLELLNTLRDITEGKIYLELARARLTLSLAEHHEKLSESAPSEPSSPSTAKSTSAEPEKKKEPTTARDHIDAAADLLSDIQVETYSSMDKREKTEFILEQMRLESMRGNWTKVRVGSRKVNRVYLKEEDVSDLKLRFYDLIVQLALQDDDFLEACNAYQAVWDTKRIKDDEAAERNVLENIIIYVILAPYNNEQNDMLHKLYADSNLQNAETHYDLLKCFVTKELMRWPGIEELYGPKIRTSPVFAPDSDLGKKTGTNAEGKKPEELEKPGEWRWEQLHKRVVEHNIRVLASYYSRIHMSRLSELLDLPPLTTERTICKLVTDKTIFARIDRPAGIVTFKKKRDANDVLNVWSTDIGKMLGLVEKASHLVSKEYAMHEASKGGKGVKA